MRTANVACGSNFMDCNVGIFTTTNGIPECNELCQHTPTCVEFFMKNDGGAGDCHLHSAGCCDYSSNLGYSVYDKGDACEHKE